jgi:hypothetical protein
MNCKYLIKQKNIFLCSVNVNMYSALLFCCYWSNCLDVALFYVKLLSFYSSKLILQDPLAVFAKTTNSSASMANSLNISQYYDFSHKKRRFYKKELHIPNIFKTNLIKNYSLQDNSIGERANV